MKDEASRRLSVVELIAVVGDNNVSLVIERMEGADKSGVVLTIPLETLEIWKCDGSYRAIAKPLISEAENIPT